MRTPPTPPRSLTRRAALRLGLAAAALAPLPAAAACTLGGPDAPEVDPLLAHLERALRDQRDALAAAAADAERAAALGVVAAQRGAHADALRAEVARAAGPSATTGAPAPTTPAGAAPTAAQVRELLAGSAHAAGEAAVELDGHRAGLLASISAACATHLAVLLP